MNAGKKNRIGRFLKPDGRSLIVAFDHGVFRGPTQGSEKPERVFEQIIEGGADGVLVTPGLATKFSDILSGRIGVILSVPMDPLYVDYASLIGADAVKTTYFGDVNDEEMIKLQEDVAVVCESYGLPYVAEVVPAVREEGKIKPIPDEWLVQVAARKAAEFGADMVKTIYTGSKESFREVVEKTFIPVVILGGEKADDRGVLNMVKEAVDAGGAGVAFGRNVWRRDNPKAMVEALKAIIHKGKGVEEALSILRG